MREGAPVTQTLKFKATLCSKQWTTFRSKQ